MIRHYWYFAGIGFKFEPYVCNKYLDISMMAYDLKNIAMINVKGSDSRCLLWNITKNDATDTLNTFQLDYEGRLRIWILVHIKYLLNH